MSTIKAIELQALGGPEQYKLVEQPLPQPGPDEVRVRVEATGIAFADVLMRRGQYPGTPKPPFVPGYDLIGLVEAVGANVSPSWMGKRVSSLIQRGGYAEAAVVPASTLVEVPSALDAAAAQALNLNYVSAWQMLHRVARVQPGQKILVQGAAGGVGTALVQLARHHGVEVWGTASAAKHHVVAPYGVHLIDYKTEDVSARIRHEVPEGLDAIFDINIGATFTNNMKLVKRGGTAIAYGFMDVKGMGDVVKFVMTRPFRSLFSGKKIHLFSIMSAYKKDASTYQEDLRQLHQLLLEGHIDPVIAERISLEQVQAAHGKFENHGYIGKVVIEPHLVTVSA